MALNWCTAIKLNKKKTTSPTKDSNPDSYNTFKNTESFDRPHKNSSSERTPKKYLQMANTHPQNSHFSPNPPPQKVKFKILRTKN